MKRYFTKNIYYNSLCMFTDFLDIIAIVWLMTILYFMLINFEADKFFFVKNRRYFSDFVAVLKISLLWHTLLLQRKWVPRKRRRYKVTEISMQPEMPIILYVHNIVPNFDEKEQMSRYKLFIDFTLLRKLTSK